MPSMYTFPNIRIGDTLLEPVECLFYYDGVVMFFSAKDTDGNHYLAICPDEYMLNYLVARVSPEDIARMKNREVPIATLFNESSNKWTVQLDENGVAAAVPVDAFDPLDLPDADALY